MLYLRQLFLQSRKERSVKPLDKFFAVSVTASVFEADIKSRKPAIIKIAQHGELTKENGWTWNIGEKRQLFRMLAIARWLQIYDDTSDGTKFDRRAVENVWNGAFWGAHTDDIVALFMGQEDAIECARCEDLKFSDPRWKANTIEVLRAVGENHPRCIITTSHQVLRLLPPEEWQEN